MKKQKTQQGITLIALIITIIVMLILVGVTVVGIQSSGLLSATQRSAREMEEAKENELGVASGQVTVGGTTYNTMQEYLDTLGYSAKGDVTFILNGTPYTVEKGTSWNEFVTDNFKPYYETCSRCGGKLELREFAISGSWVLAGTEECLNITCTHGNLFSGEVYLLPNYKQVYSNEEILNNGNYYAEIQ